MISSKKSAAIANQSDIPGEDGAFDSLVGLVCEVEASHARCLARSNELTRSLVRIDSLCCEARLGTEALQRLEDQIVASESRPVLVCFETASCLALARASPLVTDPLGLPDSWR